MSAPLSVFAPAKVNLALAVTGRRADGYHLLDTVVVFASDVGDTVEVTPAERLTLDVRGSFAPALDDADDNLVLRAARLLAAEAGIVPRARIVLHKALPVAAGIGGGSADAAATLKALDALWSTRLDRAARARIALALGADVPLCLLARAARARGIGEVLSPMPQLPDLPMVLVNPGVALSTATVFAGLTRRDSRPLPRPPALASARDAARWLEGLSNDLEAPARAFAPAVDVVLDELRSLSGCLLARMSGSGATCFALFAGRAAADRAAVALGHRRPDWWVVATTA